VRIAYLPDGMSPNAAYRSIGPMAALAARGHEVRQLDIERIDTWHASLRWCDLLHVHRVCDGGIVELALAARAARAAVVWDDDDDVTRPPPGMRGSGIPTGSKGRRRLAARTRLFELTDLVTTPSGLLAERFQQGGAREVRVLENYVIDELVGSSLPRGGLRIGWVAGDEHGYDLEHLPITEALQRLLDAHPQLHVTTIGIRLPLASERYRHVAPVPLPELLQHLATFDIGIAPLSDGLEMNHTRSNVKLKEYAVVGVPWLASPIGPYAGLGEQQGGRLVADDRWFEELDALIASPRTRRRLARRATRWGRGQLLSRNAERWELAFDDALASARARARALAV
jgi:hypothetical protein